jgi:hypothetical protein
MIVVHLKKWSPIRGIGAWTRANFSDRGEVLHWLADLEEDFRLGLSQYRITTAIVKVVCYAGNEAKNSSSEAKRLPASTK